MSEDQIRVMASQGQGQRLSQGHVVTGVREVSVPRYQNDSPFQGTPQEPSEGQAQRWARTRSISLSL